MAFISRSDRFSASNETLSVGPGAYISHQDYQPQLSYAPFSSTSPRETFRPPPCYTTPGPGSYTQKQSPPELDHWGQPKHSPPFASQISRFPQKLPAPLPGPADYKLADPWKKQKLFVKSESASYFSKIPMVRTNPSIPSSHQAPTYDENRVPVTQDSSQVVHSGTKNDSVGPGHYSIAQGLKQTGTNWHKYKSERKFHRIDTATGPEIGPGCYDKTKVKVEPMYKFKESAVFMSGSVKKMKKKEFPGPGSYNSGRSAFVQKTVPASLQNFGSSSSRFAYKVSENFVGPGYYNVSPEQKVQGDTKAPFKSSNLRFQYRDNSNPGPGTYENKDLAFIVQQKNLNLQGAFGSTKKRFDYRQQSTVPGPGQYKPELKKKKKPGPNAVFASKTKRGEMFIRTEAPPPGAYEVKIGFSVQKPPPAGVHTAAKSEGSVAFASTSERFLTAGQKDEDKPGPGSYDWKLKGSGNKVIVSSEGRFKVKRKEVPGPGDYFEEVEDRWNKKTFNVLFAEE